MKLYKVSKLIHKYSGLILFLFILWMSFSGILLNHPALIEKLSVPITMMPEKYRFNNWDRYSFRDSATLPGVPGRIFIGGKLGVWQSFDNGRTFTPMDNGFPHAAWQKDTFSLLLTSTDKGIKLFAGTRTGIFVCDPEIGQWQAEPFDNTKSETVLSLIQVDNKVLAFTPSDCFSKNLKGRNHGFSRAALPPPSALPGSRSTAGFLLRLHDGSLFGITGKLSVDFIALIFIFLSCSGIFMWIGVGRLKKLKGRKFLLKLFKTCYRYHLKIGIWGAFFLVIITMTGMLIKPPFIKWIYENFGRQVNIASVSEGQPWHDHIFKAAFLPGENKILLSTRSGFYKASAQLDKPFVKESLGVPVSGMGTTVLKPLLNDMLLVGSFKGLYSVDLASHKIIKLFPAMVSGMLIKEGVLKGTAGYKRGYSEFDLNAREHLTMPDTILKKSTIPLWFFLFELHNGKIFTSLTGSLTWLIIPVSSILILLSILTGCYDWYCKNQ